MTDNFQTSLIGKNIRLREEPCLGDCEDFYGGLLPYKTEEEFKSYCSTVYEGIIVASWTDENKLWVALDTGDSYCLEGYEVIEIE